MRVIYLIFFISLSFGSLAQWNKVNIDNNAVIKKVLFVNDSTGFVAGWSNIYRTTDYGSNWNIVFSTPAEQIIAISFPQQNVGFIGTKCPCGNAWHNAIYRTIDGGVTWVKRSIPDNTGYTPELSDICFISQDTGLVCSISANYNFVKRTTDGGLTWNTSYPNGGIQSFFKLRNDLIFGVGECTLEKTIDCGLNWQGKGIPNFQVTELSISSAYMISDSIGFLVGCDFKDDAIPIILRTVNTGDSWTQQTFDNCRGFTTGFYSVFFTSDSVGYVCGDCGKILKTSDKGNTWQTYQYGNDNNFSLFGLYFINSDIGYCGGGNVLLKTENAGGNLYNESNNSIESSFIFPNPFQSVGTLILQSYFENSQLYIFNRLGEKLRQEKINSQSVTINRSGLASGIYFYQVTNDSGIVAKGKFVIQ